MADTVPTPPSPDQAPPPAAPAAPPFDIKAIVDAFVAVLTKPAEFFASPAIQNQQGFPQPLIFAVVMGVLAGVVGLLLAVLHLGAVFGIGAGLLGLVLSPIFAVLGAFIGGAIVHVIGLIGGGKGTYEQSVRIACYAMAVFPIAVLLRIISFLPLDILANLYGLYIIALGVIALHQAKRQTVFIVVGVLAALAVIFGIVGFFAQRAAMGALQQLQQMK